MWFPSLTVPLAFPLSLPLIQNICWSANRKCELCIKAINHSRWTQLICKSDFKNVNYKRKSSTTMFTQRNATLLFHTVHVCMNALDKNGIRCAKKKKLKLVLMVRRVSDFVCSIKSISWIFCKRNITICWLKALCHDSSKHKWTPFSKEEIAYFKLPIDFRTNSSF